MRRSESIIRPLKLHDTTLWRGVLCFRCLWVQRERKSEGEGVLRSLCVHPQALCHAMIVVPAHAESTLWCHHRRKITRWIWTGLRPFNCNVRNSLPTSGTMHCCHGYKITNFNIIKMFSNKQTKWLDLLEGINKLIKVQY